MNRRTLMMGWPRLSPIETISSIRNPTEANRSCVRYNDADLSEARGAHKRKIAAKTRLTTYDSSYAHSEKRTRADDPKKSQAIWALVKSSNAQIQSTQTIRM
jgi:hypothetical protein